MEFGTYTLLTKLTRVDNCHEWSPTILRMVVHQPKDGHPPTLFTIRLIVWDGYLERLLNGDFYEEYIPPMQGERAPLWWAVCLLAACIGLLAGRLLGLGLHSLSLS